MAYDDNGWSNQKFPTINPQVSDTGVGVNDSIFTAVPTNPNPPGAGAVNAGKSQLVELPRHLFIPANAVSIDIRRVCQVSPGSTLSDPANIIIRFTAPPGAITRFISYGVFCDGELSSDFAFEPRVDGSRVFPYHGDPSQDYRINLGLGPDLSNSSLIQCNLALTPGQTVTWSVENLSTVKTVMGVRMVGYFDASGQSVSPRFG